MTYSVGTGIADITGEAGSVGMMGYALPYQRTQGIHLRQWARAFVIADDSSGKRVLFVNTDTGMIFQSVREEVLRRLAAEFGDRYTINNVMLAATHNHSGPGGYSHYTLYNLTTGGFRPKTFEALVNGIVEAVRRADADTSPGQILLNSGQLTGASANRALMAFERNPAEEKATFPSGIDPRMTVLRFQRGGRDIGVLSWFATHGTSMTNKNRLISSDNKGYAAYLWENEWAGRESLAKAQGEPGFVAGFAQSNAGDMSPNIGAGDAYGPTNNEYGNTRVIGSRQALKARELFDAATEILDGPIDFRHKYADFSDIELDDLHRKPGLRRTWPAIIGQAFTSGCFDGRGLPFIHQGEFKRHPMFKVLDRLVAAASPEIIAGHAPKPVGLATGVCHPIPWTPQILPLQIIRIGRLVLVGGPGEFTITSGKRIRDSVASQLPDLDPHVVFAGYANGYSGYITTPEEYSAQLYEGGSTHFGPATLPAYQQEFASLADALANDKPVLSTVEAPDLRNRIWSVDPVKFISDTASNDKPFGFVLVQPRPQHKPGDIVTATFVSASPNNDTRNTGTFLEIQRRDGDSWLTIATDDHWNTRFHWRRRVLGHSRATIEWLIPKDAEIGEYRILHHGTAATKSGAERFTGMSSSFQVQY